MAKGLRAKQIRELLLLPLTTLGDTVSHDGTTSYRIPGNTAAVTKVFAQTGNGTLSALPVWTDLSSIYVPFSGAGSNVDLNNKQLTNVSLLTVNGDSTINGLTVGKGLASITTNTAFGVTVLNANTTGLQNTGVGYTALMANTTGTTNTAVGDRTLLVNNTGINNTAIGGSVLRANTSGTNNTGVGVQALGSVTTGIRNVGLGVLAGFSNTVGNRTIALGNESLHSNVAGSDAIAIGYQAMYYANDTATPFTNTNIAIG